MFVGVNVLDEERDALAFVQRYSVDYPVARSRGDAVMGAYRIPGILTTVLIGTDGAIAETFRERSWEPRARRSWRRVSITCCGFRNDLRDRGIYENLRCSRYASIPHVILIARAGSSSRAAVWVMTSGPVGSPTDDGMRRTADGVALHFPHPPLARSRQLLRAAHALIIEHEDSRAHVADW